jgi:5-methylthioribose kinase
MSTLIILFASFKLVLDFNNYYSYLGSKLDDTQRDNMVKYLESQIEDIQEILDTHNSVTEI